MDRNEAGIKQAIQQSRAFILKASTEFTLSQQQHRTLQEPPVQGPIWVAHTTLAAPQEDSQGPQELLKNCLHSLSCDKNVAFHIPSISDVRGEWTAFRAAVGPDQAPPVLSDEQVYRNIISETQHDRVILFLHGGIFFMNTPASRRSIVQALSRTATARCFTPRYRLAPQNPFPAALLDILFSYLSLLYPSPGSLHEPISSSSIVLAGDSVGACLGLALVQVILTEQRRSPDGIATVTFRGKKVVLPLPAGVTSLSASLDQALALPSFSARALGDLVPLDHPSSQPNFPSCGIWPTNPPRGHVYCESSQISHPLVSPATTLDWTGAPPLWFASGEEALADGSKTVATTAARQQVNIGWTEWKMMPHAWPIVFPRWWQAEDALEEWGSACKEMLDGQFEGKGLAKGIDQQVEILQVQSLTELTPERAKAIIDEKARSMEPYTGNKKGSSRL